MKPEEAQILLGRMWQHLNEQGKLLDTLKAEIEKLKQDVISLTPTLKTYDRVKDPHGVVKLVWDICAEIAYHGDRITALEREKGKK